MIFLLTALGISVGTAWLLLALATVTALSVLVAAILMLWRDIQQAEEMGLEQWREEQRIAKLRRETEKAQARRRREIAHIAAKLRQQIIISLARQGYSWRYSEDMIPKKASRKPEIWNVVCTSDAIYYRIDKLPYRSTHADLLNPNNEVARNLALEIGREIRLVESIQYGLWIMVGLATGVAAVPKFFPWYSDDTAHNVLELLPKSKPFAVPIGVGENRKFVYQEFTDFPHLLIAGTTGGGKSIFMKQMLSTLIKRNTPNRLQVVLIDLKGGLEFWPYREIPHLRRPVVIDRSEIPDTLKEIIAEKERRFALLRNAGVNDIRVWNASRANKLPYIMVFFDEIASLMFDPQLKKEINTLVQDLAQQGRALGIHLILCTQIPKSEVINTIIKGNITSRIAFVTDMNGSMLILDNGRASKLPPGGRCIYKHAHQQREIQAPFITEEQIKEVIEETTHGEKPVGITDDDIFHLALINMGGRFVVNELYEALGGNGVSKYRIQNLGKFNQYQADNKGPVIEIDGDRYILSPPVRRHDGPLIGRRLFKVNGALPGDDELAAAIIAMEASNRSGNSSANGRAPDALEREAIHHTQ